MDYGSWFMVYDLWLMVYCLWFMVFGLWLMVESLEFEVGAQVSTYCDRGASEVVSRVRCLLEHVQPRTLPAI